jgi:hypothetical protein
MKLKELLIIVGLSLALGLSLGGHIAKKYGKMTYAHGLIYFGPISPTPPPTERISITGKIFPYILSYPKSLNLVQFPNDQNDSVGIDGPQKLILFVETITPPSGAKEFIGNYWRLYSGLSGLNSIKEFKNGQGMAGLEANYAYKNTAGQSLDIFFIIPNDNRHLVHLMKGEMEESLFREIVSRFNIK